MLFGAGLAKSFADSSSRALWLTGASRLNNSPPIRALPLLTVITVARLHSYIQTLVIFRVKRQPELIFLRDVESVCWKFAVQLCTHRVDFFSTSHISIAAVDCFLGVCVLPLLPTPSPPAAPTCHYRHGRVAPVAGWHWWSRWRWNAKTRSQIV